MKPIPTDPVSQHARFIAALCDDFASPDFLRTGKTPRADAVLHLCREGPKPVGGAEE